jgi:hypothetical protein
MAYVLAHALSTHVCSKINDHLKAQFKVEWEEYLVEREGYKVEHKKKYEEIFLRQQLGYYNHIYSHTSKSKIEDHSHCLHVEMNHFFNDPRLKGRFCCVKFNPYLNFPSREELIEYTRKFYKLKSSIECWRLRHNEKPDSIIGLLPRAYYIEKYTSDKWKKKCVICGEEYKESYEKKHLAKKSHLKALILFHEKQARLLS